MSKKLIGVVGNNKLTWKDHLHGDMKNEGLITQLKKRVGTLKRLAKFMSKKILSMFSGGIFYSKLVYCLAVLDDCNKLQVIQNSLNRLIAGEGKGTPTKDEHDANHADGGIPFHGTFFDISLKIAVYRSINATKLE